MHASEQNQVFAIIDQHATRAHEASAAWAHSSPTVRSGVLRALADALDARANELAVMADEETGLGIPRLTGRSPAHRSSCGASRMKSWRASPTSRWMTKPFPVRLRRAVRV
jgi:hypothetical protein